MIEMLPEMTFGGKTVHGMTREELIEALERCGRIILEERREFAEEKKRLAGKP